MFSFDSSLKETEGLFVRILSSRRKPPRRPQVVACGALPLVKRGYEHAYSNEDRHLASSRLPRSFSTS
jgi:hypothetical protein